MESKGNSIVRRSHLYWQIVFVALVFALLFAALRGLNTVIAPIAGALLLSYLLDPVVCLLERRWRIPRWGGTALLFVVLAVVLALVLLLVIPLAVREVQSLAQAVPGYVQRIGAVLVPWIEGTFSVQVPHTLTELFARLGADASGLAGQVLRPLGGVAGKVVRRTADVLLALGHIVLVPVFSFYFLLNFPALMRGARDLVPVRFRQPVSAAAKDIDQVLAAWVRGQLTVMACLAVGYSVGLSLVGIKMAVIIGITSGVLAFIPYVGFAMGVIMAVTVTLLEYQGMGQLVGIAVVFTVVQLAESFILTPYLVGDKTGLGPVGVLIALMVGGQLFGFVGVLLAVPVAAAAAVLLRRAIAAYKASDAFARA